MHFLHHLETFQFEHVRIRFCVGSQFVICVGVSTTVDLDNLYASDFAIFEGDWSDVLIGHDFVIERLCNLNEVRYRWSSTSSRSWDIILEAPMIANSIWPVENVRIIWSIDIFNRDQMWSCSCTICAPFLENVLIICPYIWPNNVFLRKMILIFQINRLNAFLCMEQNVIIVIIESKIFKVPSLNISLSITICKSK